MEVAGRVSLWVGNATSRAAFDAALLAAFSADGEFLGSPFSRGFSIGYYEDGLREAEYFDSPPRSLDRLLAGSSYSETTVSGFQQIAVELAPGDNCMVLLFNRSYDGRTRRWHGGGVSLRFFGEIGYMSGGAEGST